MIPSTGKRTRGKRAVAKRGMASLTHQTAMRRATAARWLAGAFPGSTGNTMRRKKEAAPSQRPTLRPFSPPLLCIAI
jgi:hypothetical protein